MQHTQPLSPKQNLSFPAAYSIFACEQGEDNHKWILEPLIAASLSSMPKPKDDPALNI